MVKRFEIYKPEGMRCPVVVVSPDELNAGLPYVMCAPMTSNVRYLAFRVLLDLGGKETQIMLDKITTIEQSKLGVKLGFLPDASHGEICSILISLFDI